MKNTFNTLVDPKAFKMSDGRTYHVGKIPVFYAQRILLACGDALKDFNPASLPEPCIQELLSYVAVETPEGSPVVLDSEETVNLLVPTIKDLLSIELKVIEENFGFFFDGSLQEIFKPIVEKIEEANRKNTETSTR